MNNVFSFFKFKYTILFERIQSIHYDKYLVHTIIIKSKTVKKIEIKRTELHGLLLLHPRTRKPSLELSFEWLESLHQDPAACLRLLSENYSVFCEGENGLGF